MTRALIVGYGSIGQRHARVLQQLGCTVGLVTQQSGLGPSAWTNLRDALESFDPHYVVIANATGQHLLTVQALVEAGFAGTVMVEKPAAADDTPWPDLCFAAVYVAYNLRFSPLLQGLRNFLLEEPALNFLAYCGQHLSTWRPGRDWRQSYSTSIAEGGGVLRDLSHELDYTLWMLGPWARLTALGGNFDALGIQADEIWSILLEAQSGAMGSVCINYLDRPARRRIVATTRRATYEVDFTASTIRRNESVQHFQSDRDATYVAMHRAALGNDPLHLCSLAEGLAVNRVITAVEKAQRSRGWVAA